MPSSLSSSSSSSCSPAAPMYITVGPQCCGKTTILKQQQILDICLDDQLHVYHYIPTALMGGNNITPQDSDMLFGKSLLERINENIEMRLLLNRWNGTLSPQNFAIGVLQLYPNKNDLEVAKEYVETVEHFLLNPPPLPVRCAIFVVQALFHKRPQNNHTTAIDRAHHLLHQAPLHLPVAWGNTNTQPRDYQTALEIASQQGRPVHFLVYGQPPHGGNGNQQHQPPAVMPAVPFQELLRRNLERFQQTGKYIPLGSMQVSYKRVEQLIQTAHSISPSSLEQGLVQQASTKDYHFLLYANRTIGREPVQNNQNQNPAMPSQSRNNKRGPGSPPASAGNNHNHNHNHKRGPSGSSSPCSPTNSFGRQPPPAQRRRRDDTTNIQYHGNNNCRPSASSSFGGQQQQQQQQSFFGGQQQQHTFGGQQQQQRFPAFGGQQQRPPAQPVWDDQHNRRPNNGNNNIFYNR